MLEAYVVVWLDLDRDTVGKLRLNSPAGGWFPALQTLCWDFSKFNLPYCDLFLSPHLTKVFIWFPLPEGEVEYHSDLLSSGTSIISTLPTSTLQAFTIRIHHRGPPLTLFKDPLSSAVLRCGPSLTRFYSRVLLSDEAMNHLVRLPNLYDLRVEGPPPNCSISPASLVFSPLIKCTLAPSTAVQWLSLFKCLEDCVPAMLGVTPMSRTKESLKYLHVEHSFNLTVDASFTSSIQIFWNLTHLNVDAHCYDNHGRGQCHFVLNNNDIAKLATALPRLKTLLLGYPCPWNTCVTTVACLLPISIHCAELEELEIHFNTANIAVDFENISKDLQFQALTSSERSSLELLIVHQMPLTVGWEECLDVGNKLIKIFPSLQNICGSDQRWRDITCNLCTRL